MSSDKGCIDSTENIHLIYYYLTATLLIAMPMSIILKKEMLAVAQYGLYCLNRYVIAYILFAYAIAQIYTQQFNIQYFGIDQRIVDMSSMDFVFSFFAFKPEYQIILGWLLLGAAAALAFRKSNLLGLFILLPMMINIVLLNFLFDICLKLNASIFLFVLLTILMPYAPSLYKLTFTNKLIPSRSPAIFTTENKLYHSISFIKLIAIVGYVTLLSNGYFQNKNRWFNLNSPILQGVWQVDSIQTATESFPKFEKFFFEKGRHGIAEIENDSVTGFQYMIDTSYNQMELWNFYNFRTLDFKGKYELLSDDSLLYTGTNQKDSLRIILSRISKYDKVIE
jgi:hypothetical protein